MTALVPFAPTTDVAEFADIIVDSAVLMVDGVQLTLSRGGWSFDPGEEWDDYSFPGKTMATVGARSLVRLKPVIKGTALLSGEDQITAYRPDGVWADHASITGARTFTPNALRAYLTEYLANVICLWKRVRGDYIAVEFPFAVCGSWSLGATDGDEGLIQITIEAVQDTTGGTTRTRLPYRIRKVKTPTDATPPPIDPILDNPIHDLDALTIALTNGASVTSWNDDSVSGDDAAPSTGQTAPTFITDAFGPGLDAVRMVGTQGLRFANPTGDSFTRYFVVKYTAAPTPAGATLFDGTTGGNNALGAFIEDDGTILAQVNDQIILPSADTTSSAWDGAIHLHCWVFNRIAGHWWWYVDDMTDGAQEADAACQAAFTFNATVVWMGSRGGVANAGTDWARELTYAGAHTEAQRNTKKAELQAVWGTP